MIQWINDYLYFVNGCQNNDIISGQIFFFMFLQKCLKINFRKSLKRANLKFYHNLRKLRKPTGVARKQIGLKNDLILPCKCSDCVSLELVLLFLFEEGKKGSNSLLRFKENVLSLLFILHQFCHQFCHQFHCILYVLYSYICYT